MHFKKKDDLHSLNISKVIDSQKYSYLNAESYRFRTPFQSQGVHGLQSLLKPARHHFHPHFPLIQDKFIYKTSLLVRCEVLGLFRNTLTAAHIYSRHNSKKSPRHVQTQLSQKR